MSNNIVHLYSNLDQKASFGHFQVLSTSKKQALKNGLLGNPSSYAISQINPDLFLPDFEKQSIREYKINTDDNNISFANSVFASIDESTIDLDQFIADLVRRQYQDNGGLRLLQENFDKIVTYLSKFPAVLDHSLTDLDLYEALTRFVSPRVAQGIFEAQGVYGFATDFFDALTEDAATIFLFEDITHFNQGLHQRRTQLHSSAKLSSDKNTIYDGALLNYSGTSVSYSDIEPDGDWDYYITYGQLQVPIHWVSV